MTGVRDVVDARDVVAEEARVHRLGSDFRWPGDKKVAVVINIAFEGWSAGKAPGLRAELDYGERKLDLAATQATAAGFAGNSSDGIRVDLAIRREACQDGMSGQAFPAAAQLTVGDRVYRGCGRFLGE